MACLPNYPSAQVLHPLGAMKKRPLRVPEAMDGATCGPDGEGDATIPGATDGPTNFPATKPRHALGIGIHRSH
jgi:hypothetical protein